MPDKKVTALKGSGIGKILPSSGPEFPLQFETDEEIVLMNWQPNEKGIGGQLFYNKADKKYGARAIAEDQKAEVIFDEDYSAPEKNNRGGFSYNMASLLKAEELASQLGAQVAILAGIELPKLEPDKWEDEDGKENDWANIQPTDMAGDLALDIAYSSVRHQFRVAVTPVTTGGEALCKKFDAAYVPRFGMDVSDQNTAYQYAEALANLFDEKSAAPAP